MRACLQRVSMAQICYSSAAGGSSSLSLSLFLSQPRVLVLVLRSVHPLHDGPITVQVPPTARFARPDVVCRAGAGVEGLHFEERGHAEEFVAAREGRLFGFAQRAEADGREVGRKSGKVRIDNRSISTGHIA